VCGLPAGSIMSLPTRVLLSETRAVGMGIFYTLFYLAVVVAPWIGGYVANIIGNSRITFDLGAAMLLSFKGLLMVRENEKSLVKDKRNKSFVSAG
jgi:MFS family permease